MKVFKFTHKNAGFGATKVHGVLLGVSRYVLIHKLSMLYKPKLTFDPDALSAPAPCTMSEL